MDGAIETRPSTAPAGVPGMIVPFISRQRTPVQLRFCVFVVAMDGSSLADLALRQACFLSA